MCRALPLLALLCCLGSVAWGQSSDRDLLRYRQWAEFVDREVVTMIAGRGGAFPHPTPPQWELASRRFQKNIRATKPPVPPEWRRLDSLYQGQIIPREFGQVPPALQALQAKDRVRAQGLEQGWAQQIEPLRRQVVEGLNRGGKKTTLQAETPLRGITAPLRGRR